MADLVDKSNEEIQASLSRKLAHAQKFNTPSLCECMDCGDDIPHKRQALGGVKRCMDCQEIWEAKHERK